MELRCRSSRSFSRIVSPLRILAATVLIGCSAETAENDVESETDTSEPEAASFRVGSLVGHRACLPPIDYACVSDDDNVGSDYDAPANLPSGAWITFISCDSCGGYVIPTLRADFKRDTPGEWTLYCDVYKYRSGGLFGSQILTGSEAAAACNEAISRWRQQNDDYGCFTERQSWSSNNCRDVGPLNKEETQGDGWTCDYEVSSVATGNVRFTDTIVVNSLSAPAIIGPESVDVGIEPSGGPYRVLQTESECRVDETVEPGITGETIDIGSSRDYPTAFDCRKLGRAPSACVDLEEVGSKLVYQDPNTNTVNVAAYPGSTNSSPEVSAGLRDLVASGAPSQAVAPPDGDSVNLTSVSDTAFAPLSSLTEYDAGGSPNPAVWRVVGTGNLDDFSASRGTSDLLWRNMQTGELSIWSLNEWGQIVRSTTLAGPPLAWEVVGVANFNTNQVSNKADILWRNASTGAYSIWYEDAVDDVSFVAQPISGLQSPAAGWFPVAAGRINGDNIPDIVWHNRNTGALTVWILSRANSGTSVPTVFSRQASANVGAAGLTWLPTGAADLNGDCRLDVVWQNGNTLAQSVWYLDGIARLGTSSIEGVTSGRLIGALDQGCSTD